MTPRRSLLALSAGALALPVAPAFAQADPRLAERSIGKADAPVTVQEFFSLTCGHCAAFSRDTLPRVKRELVDTGRIRLVYRDFPLDQLALAVAGLARSVPAERYSPFVETLFATQDRWAFNRNADVRAELWKVAALAGMDRDTFDKALVDAPLQRGILEQRAEAQRQHNISSTPSFVFGTRLVPGAIGFDRFAALVAETR